MSNRVFIGWDSRFPEPGRVLAYSLKKHSSVPLDVRFLDARHLADCYGFTLPADKLASTEFTYSRFLVPWLCGYEGKALFLDNDMVCLGNVAELFCQEMVGSKLASNKPGGQVLDPCYALRVRQHDYQARDGGVKMYGAVQTAYPRKNWSSLMLMQCDLLRCWTKEVVEEGNGARLHRFQDVPDERIAAVPDGWNDLEGQYRDCPHADLWLQYRDEMLEAEGRASKR